MEAIKQQISDMKMKDIRELMSFCKKTLEEKSKARDKALVKECIDIWDRYYHVKKNIKYQYDGADVNALKQIIKKCRGALKNDETTDDAVEAFFTAFLRYIEDEWILENLSIKMVNHKFNELLAKASKKIRQSEDVAKLYESYE